MAFPAFSLLSRSAAPAAPCPMCALRLVLLFPAITVIIFRDLISHDELFSDIYKIRKLAVRLCLEVEGKVICSLVEMLLLEVQRAKVLKAQKSPVLTESQTITYKKPASHKRPTEYIKERLHEITQRQT